MKGVSKSVSKTGVVGVGLECNPSVYETEGREGNMKVGMVGQPYLP